ncbi:MAG TPA: PQQ-dependent dehydrogenase, methanol/ethanol family [Deltaproteobacteria bacterium]|nr:PQQ-dependent dehydrogenase, methanol/ethanol family [Deltaproteobacteria bacterium]
MQRARIDLVVIGILACLAALPGFADEKGARTAGDWRSVARTPDEQRYSPLESINADNVATLQRAWTLDTGTTRGLEATPVVVDGVMYTTLSWSVVLAVDPKTGTVLWRYDPEVPRETGRKACCDVVNRGVAVKDGRVYFGTLDGRLIALDATDGHRIWEVLTVDPSLNYTITGAPRIVGDKVVIGNGGAEFNVRGYVSAYDTKDGSLVWRTFTVPGDPAKPFESKALEEAARTWKGEWWKLGGGGTVWDSMAYDPDLDLLYVGTGNGTPWVQKHRSPGGGDNLYLSSILALDPDDGHLVWHYQTTPGETWDFTATQHIILADLRIRGRKRKVLMQAPKNGFFYVLDRTNGKLISAEPYVEVTWATGIDEQGRPIETKRFGEHVLFTKPTFFGGHNWQPMSFNPKTGLVYIPAQEILGAYRDDPGFEVTDVDFNVGTDFSVFAAFPPEAASGHLLAWDPVKQKEAWRVPYGMPWNGGTLTTGGNLVFQGTADGRFVAYRADDGRTLFVDHTETGVIAAPMTFELDGVQYVSILAGWGGAFGLGGGTAARGAAAGPGRLITYALASGAPTPEQIEAFITRPGEKADGERLYHQWCSRCHGAGGVSASLVPDLRKAVARLGDSFDLIVRLGLPGTAMPKMGDSVDEREIALIRRYLEARAAETD